ncbi:hypothetical protein OPV22_024711 [Ensete ventricosum]|uniref:UDP-glycosyltransferases domain-containing protein n=1 Tax=Ensete ventricosum TaxID=4639 RepID=A0AAV8QAJ8_ENSVE|nr:hypothetical protein OPV22_024711 [Ensete ventricosum]
MDDGSLHIVMLPWPAFGHLLPFMELSKRIAQHGHRVSLLVTKRNIQRLPRVPPHLSSLLRFVELTMPSIEHLPENAEASIDLPSDELRPYLRRAFDAFQHQLSSFLQQTLPRVPDWIVLDYAAYWAPPVAAEFGVPCAFLSLFNAAVMSFLGTPAALMGGDGAWATPEQFMELPEWVPFQSTICFKPYEARELFEPCVLPDASGVSETYRFGKTMEDCQFTAVRSCPEFEPDWFHLLGKLHQRPVIPGLNARNLVERKISVEVPRNEEDGSFTGEGIATTLRSVMVEEQGQPLRAKAKECREVFGNEKLNDLHVWEFLSYLIEHRRQQA